MGGAGGGGAPVAAGTHVEPPVIGIELQQVGSGHVGKHLHAAILQTQHDLRLVRATSQNGDVGHRIDIDSVWRARDVVRGPYGISHLVVANHSGFLLVFNERGEHRRDDTVVVIHQ